MPMPPLDPLFDLVKSLSASEKRYFKVWLGKGEKDQKFALFQALDQNDHYEEKEIKAFLGDRVLGNQFSVAKNHLFRAILQCLRAYHKSNDERIQMREELDFVELQFRRGSYSSCLKSIRKLEKKALKYDYLLLQLDLIRWEKRILKWTAAKRMAEKLDDLNNKEAKLLRQIQTETELRLLYDRLFPIASGERTLEEQRLPTDLRMILENNLLSHLASYTFEAEMIGNAIHILCYMVLKDFDQLVSVHEKIIDTWNAAPHQKKSQSDRYMRAVFSYLDASLQTGRTDRFQEVLLQVRVFPGKTDQQRAWSFYLGNHLELRFLINKQLYKDALQMVPKVEAGLVTHASLAIPAVELTFFHNLMTTCFIHCEFSLSLRWTYRILNHPAIKIRKDIREVARITELINHFELENHDLVENLSAASYRRKENTETEEFLCSVLISWIKSRPSISASSYWSDARNELENLFSDVQFSVGKTELQAWLNWKMNGGLILDYL